MSKTMLENPLNQRERGAVREMIAEHQIKKRALAELQYHNSRVDLSDLESLSAGAVVSMSAESTLVTSLRRQIKDLSHANDDLQRRLNTASTIISKVRAAV